MVFRELLFSGISAPGHGMICIEYFPVVSLEPFQIPRRTSLPAPGLFLLAPDIFLHLLPAPAADSHSAVGRIPQVPSPQLSFISGCSRNRRLARVPFMIFTMSEI